MAGARLRLEADLGPLAEALGRLVSRGEDPRPTLEQVARYFEARTDERFESEAAPGGVKWPKSLRARLQSGQTLTDTARLRNSITSRVSSTAAEVGTNVIYAAIHQFGGTIKAVTAKALHFVLPGGRHVTAKQVNIPARPFLGVDDSDRAEVGLIIRAELARLAEAAP